MALRPLRHLDACDEGSAPNEGEQGVPFGRLIGYSVRSGRRDPDWHNVTGTHSTVADDDRREQADAQINAATRATATAQDDPPIVSAGAVLAVGRNSSSSSSTVVHPEERLINVVDDDIGHQLHTDDGCSASITKLYQDLVQLQDGAPGRQSVRRRCCSLWAGAPAVATEPRSSCSSPRQRQQDPSSSLSHLLHAERRRSAVANSGGDWVYINIMYEEEHADMEAYDMLESNPLFVESLIIDLYRPGGSRTTSPNRPLLLAAGDELDQAATTSPVLIRAAEPATLCKSASRRFWKCSRIPLCASTNPKLRSFRAK